MSGIGATLGIAIAVWIICAAYGGGGWPMNNRGVNLIRKSNGQPSMRDRP